jgi:uncharacterized membrane protein YjgN (DUF898 family)
MIKFATIKVDKPVVASMAITYLQHLTSTVLNEANNVALKPGQKDNNAAACYTMVYLMLADFVAKLMTCGLSIPWPEIYEDIHEGMPTQQKAQEDSSHAVDTNPER